jgi:hypothetical protein
MQKNRLPKFKIRQIESHNFLKTPYFVVLRKKSLFNWEYVTDKSDRITKWNTYKGAESYVNQEKERLKNK